MLEDFIDDRDQIDEKEIKDFKLNDSENEVFLRGEHQTSNSKQYFEDNLNTETVYDNRRERKEKEATSYLRDEFLGILFTITNQPIEIQFEKTKDPLSAIFAGSDFTFSTITVKDLKTSLGKEPFSLLRTSDISSVNYEMDL